MGGLGNQMFQYAAARSLSLKRGIPFSVTFDDPYKFVARKYALDIFQLDLNFAGMDDLRKYAPKTGLKRKIFRLLGKNPDSFLFQEKEYYVFDPAFFDVDSHAYLRGFWQSYLHFEDIRAALLNDFGFKQPLSGKNKEWAKLASESNSISIHVRRGDYVSVAQANKSHGVIEVPYYEQAIKAVSQRVEQARFFVFSDDMPWVRENLKLPADTVFVEGNDGEAAFEDMRLMTHCKHNIIANSSFSWWGAWLNQHPDKLVVAPNQWTTSAELKNITLAPAEWIII